MNLHVCLQSMLQPQQLNFDAQYFSHLSRAFDAFDGDCRGVVNDFKTSLLPLIHIFPSDERINSLENAEIYLETYLSYTI